MTEITRRVIVPVAAGDRESGNWLWGIQDTRERTKRMVSGLSVEELDALPTGLPNSIGTLLYHIALIEADYLCIDVMGRESYLPELQAILPWPDRDERGGLSVASGLTLEEHLTRLDTVRERLIDVFTPFTRQQLDQPRLLADWNYEISPAWTLHHLMQHEAEHRGEMGSLLTILRAPSQPSELPPML